MKETENYEISLKMWEWRNYQQNSEKLRERKRRVARANRTDKTVIKVEMLSIFHKGILIVVLPV